MSLDVVFGNLLSEARFVCWTYENGGAGKFAKVPRCPHAPWQRASSTDPATWGTFDEAVAAFEQDSRLAGVGIVLTPRLTPLVVLDLDGVTDEALMPRQWAADIIAEMDTFTELSVSGHGIHVFTLGTKPAGVNSSRLRLPEAEGNTLEIYDDRRFIALTGAAVGGFEHLANRAPQLRQEELEQLCQRCIQPMQAERGAGLDGDLDAAFRRLTCDVPVDEMDQRELRCFTYLDQIPPAISGQNDSGVTFRAACTILRFGLSPERAWRAIKYFNQKCQPPWSRHELEHKLTDAARQVVNAGEFGSLLNTGERK